MYSDPPLVGSLYTGISYHDNLSTDDRLKGNDTYHAMQQFKICKQKLGEFARCKKDPWSGSTLTKAKLRLDNVT